MPIYDNFHSCTGASRLDRIPQEEINGVTHEGGPYGMISHLLMPIHPSPHTHTHIFASVITYANKRCETASLAML